MMMIIIIIISFRGLITSSMEVKICPCSHVAHASSILMSMNQTITAVQGIISVHNAHSARLWKRAFEAKLIIKIEKNQLFTMLPPPKLLYIYSKLLYGHMTNVIWLCRSVAVLVVCLVYIPCPSEILPSLWAAFSKFTFRISTYFKTILIVVFGVPPG
jgi:hypothetical protein